MSLARLMHNNNLNQESSMLSRSSSNGNSGSDSEKIEILELRKRLWKDQILLNKLEGTSKQAAEQSEQCTNPCWCSLVQQWQRSRKTELSREDGVLHYMLKLMRDCDARGFVYGILPTTGPPITGSSDSLSAWWKDTVAFDRNAPPSVVTPAAGLKVVEQILVSNLHKLQDMNDNTIGSILSALIQHCKPPQRSCPLDEGLAPPWWPTGNEMWWGLQGQVHAQLGPPPYRKPHDLRKGWKLSLLAAVIKHMSPRFDDMRSLVWHSKRLQHKMSAKDVDTWLWVLNREEALIEETKKLLVISTWDNGSRTGSSDILADYFGDELTGTCRKRKWGFGAESWCKEDFISGDSCPNLELGTMLQNKPGASKMGPEQSVQCANSHQCYMHGGVGHGGGNNISDGSDYVDSSDDTDCSRKLWRLENGEGSSEGFTFTPGELWPDLELDSNSIHQFMMSYAQEFFNSDLGPSI